MKSENLFNAMNYLDPRLIAKSAPSNQARKNQASWIKWVSIAACLCLCAAVCFGAWQGGIIGGGNQDSKRKGEDVTPDQSSAWQGEIVVEGNQDSDKQGENVTPDHSSLWQGEIIIEGNQEADNQGGKPAPTQGDIWQGEAVEGKQEIGGQGEEFVLAEKYVYQVDEGQFSAYVGGKVIAEDTLGGKLADVTLTAGWKNAVGSEWLSQERLRGEVYSINGIASDVAVALKFLDKGEAVTTDHYYVLMNPDADLSAVEAYIIQPINSAVPGELTAE